mmetsp:Transcript_7149/g.12784  ORF Transcript_7149/g.12784 Transcript_7149/m.12784 type:complete len:88 (-) Transcript_7149:282-545(-)
MRCMQKGPREMGGDHGLYTCIPSVFQVASCKLVYQLGFSSCKLMDRLVIKIFSSDFVESAFIFGICLTNLFAFIAAWAASMFNQKLA